MPEIALRHNRDFRLLWIGQAVSTLGSNISAVSYPLLVLATGGSAAAAGLIGFLAMLPNAVVQLPAGALVDRWDRKRVMLVSDAGRLIALATVAIAVIAGSPPLALLAVAALIEGTLSVFFNLAEFGAVRHVVPETQFSDAIAQNEARTRGAALLGQPLGGFLFGLRHAVPFLADAISYLISFTTLAAIRADFNDERTATSNLRRLPSEIREGVGWIWRQPFLRAAALIFAANNFIVQALVLSLIVLTREHGAPAGEIGLMLAGFGVGGLIGAIASPWLQSRISPRAVIAGSNWLCAIAIPLMALWPHPAPIAALAGAMALLGPMVNVVMGTARLRLTPDALLGRVTSASGVIAAGAIPFGSLIGGALLARFGGQHTILILAGLTVILAIVATWSPDVRRYPAPEATRTASRQFTPE
ncbi:MAG TPA: MFS transporter [Thermomicrobiales bacterium]|nr:MFS transporter [Thermomicrobiales bacterium]